MNLYLCVLLIYAGVLLAIGLWSGRRVGATSDFFVAGRRLGPGLIFATLLAINIGAGSTVGAAGLGYRDGLSASWWVGSAGIGSIVLAFWIGPRFRQLAAAHNLRTVGDFLEHRYGRETRAAIAILLWVGTLFILAAQLMAMGFVLGAVSGLDRWIGSRLFHGRRTTNLSCRKHGPTGRTTDRIRRYFPTDIDFRRWIAPVAR